MDVVQGLVPTDLLKDVIQIGIIVEDLQRPIEGMRKVFGVEPTKVFEAKYPWVRYRDEPVESWATIASYMQFGVELEFMEPMGGDSAWKDHIIQDCRARGHAIHHIRFADVEDNDVVSRLLAERGIEIYQEGGSIVTPGGKFTYYDTVDELGFVIEVVTRKKDDSR
ncbi:MAG: VOC family protein [Coriobacteriia bacterium]|nr:VOC family protein [Coriobacteriia bacterium]